VPLRSAILRGLVDRYLDAVTAPLFTATRGMVVRPATPQRPAAVSRVEALGDAVLPAALRARIRSAGLARLVVVPDDALHALPLECLALPSDRGPVYALDELPPIAYAPSAAILGVVAGRPRRLDRPPTLLTVGDPAYPEFPPAPPPSPVAPPGREPVVVAVNRAAGTRAESGAVLLRDSLPRLEGTRVESGRVRAFFPSDRVTALEGADATERKVVAAVPGKRVVHLAAHGFADPAFGDLQAAVALAYTPTANPDPADDGMLTLNEINLLKLDGCDLTVLSACVTNVGRRRSLEAGVTLAGGFLSAGARGVVASCWPVSDASTADLMAEFFRQARPADPTPGSYADALKAARLKVRATPGYEAPFHWAAFVYLGMPD
jgi:CHAT domain-containing protein